MDYSDFYCCADCEYHFVDGDSKKRNPKQYLDCDHFHKEIVDGRLVCLRCGYEGKKEETRTPFTRDRIRVISTFSSVTLRSHLLLPLFLWYVLIKFCNIITNLRVMLVLKLVKLIW